MIKKIIYNVTFFAISRNTNISVFQKSFDNYSLRSFKMSAD